MWETPECCTTSWLKPAKYMNYCSCQLRPDSLTLKEPCYFLPLGIKLTCWLLPSLPSSIWSLTSMYLKSFPSLLSLFAAICSYSLAVKYLFNSPNIPSPVVLCFRFFFPLQHRKGTTEPFNTLKEWFFLSTLKVWRQLPKRTHNSMDFYIPK